jgi:hypothetical protein
MIGEIPLHIVLLALSLDGRLKRDKPRLIVVEDKIEIAPPKCILPRRFKPKKKSMFFIEEDN